MFLIEHIVIAIQVRKAYHAFHSVREFHIETVVADSRDHTGEFLADMVFHELDLLRLVGLPLRLVRKAFPG